MNVLCSSKILFTKRDGRLDLAFRGLLKSDKDHCPQNVYENRYALMSTFQNRACSWESKKNGIKQKNNTE